MPVVLAPFFTVTAVLSFVAIALGIAYIVGSIAGVFRPIPLIGGPIASAMEAVGRAIASACGHIMNGVEAVVGASWHWTARYLEQQWEHDVEGDHVSAAAATEIHRQAVGISRVGNAAHKAASIANTHTTAIGRIEKQLHGIDRQIKELEQDVSKGIGADVQPQLKHLQKEITNLTNAEATDIANAKAAADSAISDLWGWLTGLGSRPRTLTFTGAVSVAIGALGLNWLRCGTNPFSTSKNPCGIWSDLANFLPLLGLLAIAFDFQEFTAAAIEVADGIGTFVAGIEGTFELSLPPLPPPN